jgi:hypothetical protein
MDFSFKITEKDKEQFQELFRQVIKEELGHLITVNKDTQEEDELISLEDALKLIGCSKTTLYHYRRKGLISYSQLGRKIKFKRSELFKVVNNQSRFRRVS